MPSCRSVPITITRLGSPPGGPGRRAPARCKGELEPMRRFAITAAVLLVTSGAVLVGGAIARPDLVPAWARARLHWGATPTPDEEADHEPSNLEDGPDDGWIDHLGPSARQGVRRSLPTVRL